MPHSHRRRFAATNAPIVGCWRSGGRHGCGHCDGRHRVRVGFDINQNRFLRESLVVRQPSVAVLWPWDCLATKLQWLQTIRRGVEILTTANNSDALFVYLHTVVQRSPFAETGYRSTNLYLQQDRRKRCTKESADNLPPMRVPSVWTKWPPTARDACEYYCNGGEERATARERNLGLDFSFQRRPSPLLGEPWQPRPPLSPPLGGRNLHPFPVKRRGEATASVTRLPTRTLLYYYNTQRHDAYVVIVIVVIIFRSCTVRRIQYAYYCYLYNALFCYCCAVYFYVAVHNILCSSSACVDLVHAYRYIGI